MKKLLKSYAINSDQEYYEIIVESVTNGNRYQAIEQFKAMPKQNRRNFIVWLRYEESEIQHYDYFKMFVDQL